MLIVWESLLICLFIYYFYLGLSSEEIAKESWGAYCRSWNLVWDGLICRLNIHKIDHWIFSFPWCSVLAVSGAKLTTVVQVFLCKEKFFLSFGQFFAFVVNTKIHFEEEEENQKVPSSLIARKRNPFTYPSFCTKNVRKPWIILLTHMSLFVLAYSVFLMSSPFYACLCCWRTYNSFHNLLQGEGTLLATGSYDGQARIWSTDGKLFILTCSYSSVLLCWIQMLV